MDRLNLESMGRRRFMNVASAIGVSSSSLTLGTQEGLAKAIENPDNEVPYVAWMNLIRDDDGTPLRREPHYKTIPRDEWADLETAKRAATNIQQTLRTKGANQNLINAGFRKMDDSPTGWGVIVEYVTYKRQDDTITTPPIPFDKVQSIVPQKATASVGKDDWSASRTNIPVRVEEKTQHKVGYEDDWSTIPAACAVNDPNDPDYPPGSTTAWYYENSSSDYYLMTAGHVAGDSNTSWGQPDVGDDDGIVYRSVDEKKKDYGLLNPYYSTDYQYGIREPDSKTVYYHVDGTYTDEGLQKDIVNTGRDVTYQGATTGRTTTRVVEFFEGDSSQNDDQYVEVTQSAQTGDSGGILFRDIGTDDGVKVIGTIFSFAGGYGAQVQTAEAMENGFDGWFV